MRIWILSDLHIEQCRWDLPDPAPDFDLLIAAGDIHDPLSEGVRWIAERANGRPVIYVPGNHGWYAHRQRFTIEGSGNGLLRWWGNDLFHDNLALGIDGPDIPQNAAVLEIHDHKSLRPMTPVSNLSSGNIRISLRPSVARHKPDEQGKASEPQCAH